MNTGFRSNAALQTAEAVRSSGTAAYATFKVTQIDPINSEIAARIGTEAPHTLRVCFTDSAAPVPGTYLKVAAKTYGIKAVSPWEYRGGTFCELILEDLQNGIPS